MRMKETLARLVALGASLALSACALIYDYSSYGMAGGGGTPDAGPGSGPGPGSGESSAGSGGGHEEMSHPEGSIQLGGAGQDTLVAMDVDTLGNVFVLGAFEGSDPFGNPDVDVMGDEQGLFLVKLDPSGNVLWSKLLAVSTKGTPPSADLAVTLTGLAAVTGGYQKKVNLGAGTIPSFGKTNGFAAVLDANGGFIWSKRFGNAESHAGTGVAITDSGMVAITGFCSVEKLNLGDTCEILTPNMSITPFVATFDYDGKCMWARTFEGSDDAFGEKVAIDDDGNVILTGYFKGTITLTSALNGKLIKKLSSKDDGFVIKLSADSSVVFGRSLAAEARARVVTDAENNILLSGTARGNLYFDDTQTNYGGFDMMAVSLAPSGAPNWSRLYGGPGDDALALTFAGEAGFVVAGATQGNITWGGETLMSAGSTDAFVGALSSEGNPKGGAALFGGVQAQAIAAVRLDNFGNRIVAGQFEGSLDFGKGPLSSRGDQDIFVAWLPPASP